MTQAQHQAVALGIVPRAPRIPSDINDLLAATPMEHTFRAFGQHRLDAVKAAYIASLIADSLAGR